MNRSLQDKHHDLAIDHAQQIATILRENPESIFERPIIGRLPGDPFAIRGIPAIGGRGSVGGAIAGTRPDARY